MQWLDTVQATSLWHRQQRLVAGRRQQAFGGPPRGPEVGPEEAEALAAIAAESAAVLPQLSVAICAEECDGPLALVADPAFDSDGTVGLQVFVRTATDEVFPVDVSADATVMDVKKQLVRLVGAPVRMQELSFGGATLSNGTALADAGVGQEACLYVKVTQRPEGFWRHEMLGTAWELVSAAQLRDRIGTDARHLFRDMDEHVLLEDFGTQNPDRLDFAFVGRRGEALDRALERTTTVASLFDVIPDGALLWGDKRALPSLPPLDVQLEGLCTAKAGRRMTVVKIRAVLSETGTHGEGMAGDTLPVSKVPISLARRRARDFMTPLHVAASKGELREVNRMLDEAGESAELLINSWDCRGRTPLQLALEGGAGSVAVLLLDRGAFAAPLLREPMLLHTGALIGRRGDAHRSLHSVVCERLARAAADTLEQSAFRCESWQHTHGKRDVLLAAARCLPDGSPLLLRLAQALVGSASGSAAHSGAVYALLMLGHVHTAQDLLPVGGPEMASKVALSLIPRVCVHGDTGLLASALRLEPVLQLIRPSLRRCYWGKLDVGAASFPAAHFTVYALATLERWGRRMRGAADHLAPEVAGLAGKLRLLRDAGAHFGLSAIPTFNPKWMPVGPLQIPFDWGSDGEVNFVASPLWMAIRCGYAATVRTVCELGLDVNAVCLATKQGCRDWCGTADREHHYSFVCSRPLAVAVSLGKADVTAVLMENGADPCRPLRIAQFPLSRYLVPFEDLGLADLSAPKPAAKILNDGLWLRVFSFLSQPQDAVDRMRLTCRANCARFSNSKFWKFDPIPLDMLRALGALGAGPEAVNFMEASRSAAFTSFGMVRRQQHFDLHSHASLSSLVLAVLGPDWAKAAVAGLEGWPCRPVTTISELAATDECELREALRCPPLAVHVLSAAARQLLWQCGAIRLGVQGDGEEGVRFTAHVAENARSRYSEPGCDRLWADFANSGESPLPGFQSYNLGFAAIEEIAVAAVRPTAGAAEAAVRAEGIRDSIVAVLPALEARGDARPLLATVNCGCSKHLRPYASAVQYPLTWAIRHGFTDLATRLFDLAERSRHSEGEVFVGLVGNVRLLRCKQSPYSLDLPRAGCTRAIATTAFKRQLARSQLRWLKQGRSYCMPAVVRPAEEQVVVGDSVPQAILSLPPGAVRLELWRKGLKHFRKALGSVFRDDGAVMLWPLSGFRSKMDHHEPVTVTNACAARGAAAELEEWLKDADESAAVHTFVTQAFRTLLHAVKSGSAETYSLLRQCMPPGRIRPLGYSVALAHCALSRCVAVSERLPLLLLSELEAAHKAQDAAPPPLADVLRAPLLAATDGVLQPLRLREWCYRSEVDEEEQWPDSPDGEDGDGEDGDGDGDDGDDYEAAALQFECPPALSWGFRLSTDDGYTVKDAEPILVTTVRTGKAQSLRWMLSRLSAEERVRLPGWKLRCPEVGGTMTLLHVALGMTHRGVTAALTEGVDAPEPTDWEPAFLRRCLTTSACELEMPPDRIAPRVVGLTWQEMRFNSPRAHPPGKDYRCVPGTTDTVVVQVPFPWQPPALPDAEDITMREVLASGGADPAAEGDGVSSSGDEPFHLMPFLAGERAADVVKEWGLGGWWRFICFGARRPPFYYGCPAQPTWERKPMLRRLTQPPLRGLKLPTRESLRRHFRDGREPGAVVFLTSDGVIEIPAAVAVPGEKGAGWELADTSVVPIRTKADGECCGPAAGLDRVRCKVLVVDGSADRLRPPLFQRFVSQLFDDPDCDPLHWSRDLCVTYAERGEVSGDVVFEGSDILSKVGGDGPVLGPVSLYLPDYRASTCDFRFVDATEAECTEDLCGYFERPKTASVPLYKRWQGGGPGKDLSYYIRRVQAGDFCDPPPEDIEKAAEVLLGDGTRDATAPEDYFYVLAVRLPTAQTADFLGSPRRNLTSQFYTERGLQPC